jgi:hypothetical protein
MGGARRCAIVVPKSIIPRRRSVGPIGGDAEAQHFC